MTLNVSRCLIPELANGNRAVWHYQEAMSGIGVKLLVQDCRVDRDSFWRLRAPSKRNTPRYLSVSPAICRIVRKIP